MPPMRSVRPVGAPKAAPNAAAARLSSVGFGPTAATPLDAPTPASAAMPSMDVTRYPFV